MIKLYIETMEYSLSVKQWEELRELFPKTYNECLSTMKSHHNDNKDKALKEEGYLYKTTKGLEIIDEDASIKKITEWLNPQEGRFHQDDIWHSHNGDSKIELYYQVPYSY